MNFALQNFNPLRPDYIKYFRHIVKIESCVERFNPHMKVVNSFEIRSWLSNGLKER